MLGIGDHDGHKCPTHDLNARASKTLVANLTFYDFSRILAGACTAVACLVSFIHMCRHATHLTVPRQQVKVMRVIALVPLYAIVNLFIVCFPSAEVYLDPILDLLQALCLASYFMLLCEYISPHAAGRDGFFAQIEIRDKKAEGGLVRDGVKWFAQRSLAIFQYPLVALAVALATVATELAGVYCRYESRADFAQLYLSVVGVVSSGLAITAVVLVALQIRAHMPRLRPVAKLAAIKLVVGLAFLQQIVFWVLQSTHVLRPTDALTYADLHYGVPALLSCLEMVPVAAVVVWAYPVGPYRLDALDARGEERGEGRGRSRGGYVPSSYQGGVLGLRAFTSMLNPVDVVKASAAAFSVAAQGYAASKTEHGGRGRLSSARYRQDGGGGYDHVRGHSRTHGHVRDGYNGYTGYNGSYQTGHYTR